MTGPRPTLAEARLRQAEGALRAARKLEEIARRRLHRAKAAFDEASKETSDKRAEHNRCLLALERETTPISTLQKAVLVQKPGTIVIVTRADGYLEPWLIELIRLGYFRGPVLPTRPGTKVGVAHTDAGLEARTKILGEVRGPRPERTHENHEANHSPR